MVYVTLMVYRNSMVFPEAYKGQERLTCFIHCVIHPCLRKIAILHIITYIADSTAVSLRILREKSGEMFMFFVIIF